ncbi:MAG: putative lipid II flippase FtsW [Chloroflexi bacterium]|nr:putative lipid II flippase FtsW [Chloroflexota bacterium]
MMQSAPSSLLRPESSRAGRTDYWLLALVGALVVVGLQAVYSASFAIGLAEFGDGTYFVARQAMWAVVGLVAMLVCMRIDYRRWRRISPLLFLLALVALGLVLLPGAGVSQYGAQRWLRLGPLPALQPSEFVKLAFVLYLAAWLASRPERAKSLSNGFIPFGIITGLVLGPIMLQPDLGTALIISLTAVTLLFLAGADLRYFTLMLGGGLALGVLLIGIEGYRLSRWYAFVDPWADPAGKGFQIIQLLIALGSGGLTGLGIGASRQKFFWVPGSHTDGIFAIIGEELGFIGAVLVIALYVGLAYRGFRIASQAQDHFGRLLALGIVCWIAFQALVNLGGITRSVPLAGVPLPLISYGGSSLAAIMAALGILLNISRQTREDLAAPGPLSSAGRAEVGPGGG